MVEKLSEYNCADNLILSLSLSLSPAIGGPAGSKANSLGGSLTAIVRHYFENITRSPNLFMQRSSSSTELEDSGFQVQHIAVDKSNNLAVYSVPLEMLIS